MLSLVYGGGRHWFEPDPRETMVDLLSGHSLGLGGGKWNLELGAFGFCLFLSSYSCLEGHVNHEEAG